MSCIWNRRMARHKRRPLVVVLVCLMSVIIVTFCYVSSSPVSAFYSVISVFRSTEDTNECQSAEDVMLSVEDVMLINRNNQYSYIKLGSYKSNRLRPENRSKHEATAFPERAVESAAEGDEGPPLEMELARRSVAQTSSDLYLFLRYQLKRLQHEKVVPDKTSNPPEKIIEYVLGNLAEYYSAIDDQLRSLAENDGWNTWRKQELKNLQNTVQERLYALQNPENCSSAPVLLCNLTNSNGFASGIHDVLWCFIKAYYTHQRMVLVTSTWHYARGGWETLFKPLSDTCKGEMGKPHSTGPGKNGYKARRLLALLPSDLGPRILRMHSNPLAWWYGQFLSYLMRPNARLEAFLNDTKQKINFTDTIVGVHVRRTDKVGTEAKSYMLDEYMGYVEDYFIGKEMIQPSPMERRIYMATDEPQVIKECQDRFKEYVCIYNSGGAIMASNINTRYSNESLFGVLADVFMLANTNFLVCTFSSGLCRLAYELMQAFHLEDYSDRYVSLDAQYYYAWSSHPQRIAVYNHKARSPKELNFKEGEVFQKKDYSILYHAMEGEKNDGFSHYVKYLQKDREWIIPTFKTKEIPRFFRTHDFLDYNLSDNVTR